MIDTPRELHDDAIRTWGTIIIPEDIYRYLILVDVVETARFLNQSRIKRSKRFSICLNPPSRPFRLAA
jgi:hypothetical protein